GNKSGHALERCSCKIAFGFAVLICNHLETLALQFCELGDHFHRICRRRRIKHRQAGTFRQRFRFSRSPVAHSHSRLPSTGLTSVITPWRLSCETIFSCWLWLTTDSNSTIDFPPAMDTRKCCI